MSVTRKQALQAVLVATCLGLLVATPVSAREAQSGADRGQTPSKNPTWLPHTLPLGRSAALTQDGSTASSPLQLLGKAQQLTLFNQARQHHHQQHLEQHQKQQPLWHKQLKLWGRQPQHLWQMSRSLLATPAAPAPPQTLKDDKNATAAPQQAGSSPASVTSTPVEPLKPSFAASAPAANATAPAAPAAPAAPPAAPPAAEQQPPAPTLPPPGYFQVVALPCNTAAAGVAGKNCSQWLDAMKSVLSSWGQGPAQAVFLCCSKSLPTTFDVEATELGVQQSEATLILYYSCSRAGTYEVQIGKYRMPGEGRIVKLSPCSQTESQLFIAAPIVA